MEEYSKIQLRIQLTLARVEILKLKSDDYNWQCHVPEDVKKQLIDSLTDIDKLMKNLE